MSFGFFCRQPERRQLGACFPYLSPLHAFCSQCSLWGLGERRSDDKAHVFREESGRWKQIRVKQKAQGENVFTNGYRHSPVYFTPTTPRLQPIDARVLTAIHCTPRKGHVDQSP